VIKKSNLFCFIYTLISFIVVAILSYVVEREVNWILAVSVSAGVCIGYTLFYRKVRKPWG